MRSEEMLQKTLPVFFALVVAIAVGIFLLTSRDPLSPQEIDDFARRQLEHCANMVAKRKPGSPLQDGANCKMFLQQRSRSLVNSQIRAVSDTRYVITGVSRTGHVFTINTEDFLVEPETR